MALTSATAGAIFPRRSFQYGETDTILYALAIGAAADGDAADLPFVYESALRAYPSQATVIAWDDSWIRKLGLNEQLIVHGEQRITLHRPLPTRARIRAQSRIKGVVDKGAGRGALLYVETRIEDVSERPLATLLSTVFARGDGGFGGDSVAALAPHAIPNRTPDIVWDAQAALNQAFLYRLCGDRNPLHVDPDVARRAGFERPILHGLCTYGMAVRAIIRGALDNDPTTIEHVAARFSAPLYPGERVQTLIWREGRDLSFRMQVAGDGRTVLDNGLVRLRALEPMDGLHHQMLV
jgi:acyl dehydratase